MTLIHQEDSGIPRAMAKMAIRKGAWNYVKKMGPALKGYSRWHATRRVPKESAVTLAHKLPEHLDPEGQHTQSQPEAGTSLGGSGLRRTASMRGSRRRAVALVAAGALIAVASGGAPALGLKAATMVAPFLGWKLRRRRENS